ncbi:thiol peroxidase [Geofilum rubicundum]|uniref:Thiol peroxidase n=1 Tax=Geofilum rubicundum JCM 15548 TaxID=1236989 RepID=A0A0E9LSU5_9BACT|nr:thiol peroxidase [Geofilum rubicundum]GAO28226.1 thiol peroxidase, Tpx-type [Geofilum rubicundum JCM 15548]
MDKNNVKVTFKGNPVTLLGKTPKVGETAPDFTALSSSLEPVKLSDYEGKVKIIAVYPSIDTGVCAAQNRRFNEEADKLDGVAVLSVSVDLPFAQSRFCAAEGLNNIVTLSDHKELDFGAKYGFVIEELRLLARGTVIIGKDNKIKYIEYVPEIAQEPDYEAALKVAKELI